MAQRPADLRAGELGRIRIFLPAAPAASTVTLWNKHPTAFHPPTKETEARSNTLLPVTTWSVEAGVETLETSSAPVSCRILCRQRNTCAPGGLETRSSGTQHFFPLSYKCGFLKNCAHSKNLIQRALLIFLYLSPFQISANTGEKLVLVDGDKVRAPLEDACQGRLRPGLKKSQHLF